MEAAPEVITLAPGIEQRGDALVAYFDDEFELVDDPALAKLGKVMWEDGRVEFVKLGIDDEESPS